MPTVSIQSLQLVPIYFYVISNSLCLPWYLKDLWHRKAKGLRSRVRKWWKSRLHSALNGNSSSPRGQIKAPEWRVLQYSHHCSAPDGTRVSCAAKAVAPNRNLPAVSACFMAFFYGCHWGQWVIDIHWYALWNSCASSPFCTAVEWFF